MKQKGLFGWNNVSTGALSFICIFLLSLFSIIWKHESVYFPKFIHNFWIDIIVPTLETCFKSCDTNTCHTMWDKTRGKNYWAGMGAGKCYFNGWEVSHIITHVILGYFGNIYISQSVSFGFEFYEYKYESCESYMDLVWNFTGFCIGHTLRHGFDGL